MNFLIFLYQFYLLTAFSEKSFLSVNSPLTNQYTIFLFISSIILTVSSLKYPKGEI